MQKIILDTNIVVSSLIKSSYPYYIVFEYVLEEKVNLCLSKNLFDEYCDVLARSKFSKIQNFKINANIVLKRFVDIAMFYEPKICLDILKDKDDNMFFFLSLQKK